ncbi:type VI secretion system protein TssA [Dyella sp. 2RAB6]|uniref:type VI secretion system protein TssA n=1 Tax=Dyella sp. 2RAB6 TaxID=3232992 RepID=UPI003F8E3163
MSQYAQARSKDVASDEAMPEAAAMGRDDGGYFEHRLGLSLARLLAPLDGAQPAGASARGSMGFRMIQQLRQSDDASLPMGAWATEPRRANWPKVSQLAAGMLDTVGKDLQLAAWMLEAELHEGGYAALMPCFALLRGLCEDWWDSLHPRGDGDGYDARCNIVRWINEKLLNTIALLPLVEDDEHVASWSQWELAHYHERMRAVNGNLPDEAQDAATLDDLHGVLARMDAVDLRERHAELGDGRAAIAAFEHVLREQLGPETPPLGRLDEFLARIEALLRGELTRRGPAALPPVAPLDFDQEAGEEDEGSEPRAAHDLFGERERAYQVLAQIGEYLMQVEPHSPVPYLIRRAVAWGGLNAAELYREVFQKGGGRIEIFELLGGEAES